jgi:hypothetical protein
MFASIVEELIKNKGKRVGSCNKPEKVSSISAKKFSRKNCAKPAAYK